MGKPLSRPDCLRKRPRCLGKGVQPEGYMEDCYVPQRSIYDTMRINEHIDQGPVAGDDSTLSSNGTPGAAGGGGAGGGAGGGSAKRLDERVIFDSLKLTAEAQGGAGGGSVSPSVSSTGSAPSGFAAATRRRSQGSDKREAGGRRSLKTFAQLEVSPGESAEKPLSPVPPPPPPPPPLPPLISPLLPTPLNPQRTPQPLPARGPLPSPPGQLSFLQKSPQWGRGRPAGRGLVLSGVPLARQERPVRWRVSDPGSERDFPVLDQDLDTAPLLPSLSPVPPDAEDPPDTCTWPRRLMGRRRTVSQGGVLHKLPILPPLPPLLAEHSEADEESLRLLDTPSSLSQVLEGVSPEGVANEAVTPEGVAKEGASLGWPAEAGGVAEGGEEAREGEMEARQLEEGWEEVLQKVDSLWEECEEQGWGPRGMGSLGPWPILPPPLGFGGTDSPSRLSSAHGSLDPLPGGSAGATPPPARKAEGGQADGGGTGEISPKTETDPSEEPGSEHTRGSESSGVQMSGRDRSGRSDTASSAERREYDSDLGSAASLDREEEEGRKEGTMGGVCLEIRRSSPSLEDARSDREDEGGASEDKHGGGMRGQEEEEGTGEKRREEQEGGSEEGGLQGKEIQTTTSDSQDPAGRAEPQGVPTVTGVTVPRLDSPPSRADSPLPLSPSKHEVRGSGLESENADAFVVTDSFVYLAVSALPAPAQTAPLSPLQESSSSGTLLQPRPDPEEGDFLSTDSFVYLAAPERSTLAGSGSSGANSQDSDSDAAQSGVDFAPGSTTADSDSDASKSEPDLATPLWDQWEELEPSVLRRLFCDDQSESGVISEGQSETSVISEGQSEQDLICEGQSEQGVICEGQLQQVLISESQSERGVICKGQLEQGLIHESQSEQGLIHESQSEQGLICEGQSEQDLICKDQSEQGISGPGGPGSEAAPEQEGGEPGSPMSCEEEVAETTGEVVPTPPSATPPGAGSGSERFLALEQARVPLTLFWETHRKLEPWLEETEALIGRLPSPAVDLETLRTQQDQIRVLKESVLGHQCHVDKLLLIGPMLDPGSQEGAAMRQSCSAVERRYLAIKEGVRGHSAALEEAISQSSQFHDKMEPLLETLERAVQRLRQRPPVAVELEKLREQLAVHRAAGQELDKLLPAYNALCSHGDDPAAHVPHAHPGDPASQAVRSRLQRLRSLWAEIRQRAQEREAKLLEALDLAGRFWAESGALLGTLRDAQDITRKLEDPAVSPAHITQQLETTKAWRAEMGRLSEQLQALSMLGDKLITVCGDTEKPLVRKSLEETQAALQSLNRMLEERMQRLETAMTTAVQYQDALQGMFGYLDKAAMELRNMPTVGAELGAVQQQIHDLKLFKAVVLQQQRDMQKVRQQGELLVRSASAQTDREAVREPLTHLTHLWKSLGDEVTHRQHELEVALLSLGQLQQALMEAESWLSQSHVTLDALRPISCDPKAIEMELANHQVFRDDVLSRRATMEALSRAASSQLLEPDPGEEASRLRQQLETVHHSWESLLFKTQGRQDLLEAALAEAEGFHGEVQVCLQWLRDTERQLSTTKPTGGLPETAREQLRQHMELQGQVSQQANQYHDLVARGQAMLMSLLEGEEGGFGATQTQQNLLLLQNTWASLTTKMDNRRVKLEEAVSLATGFQSSLQVCVNWLIQAEQSLNMAPPPSLVLETLLLQIEEHKVFMSEVNSHRQQVLVLEKVGSELRSASLEQDEVLIGNLLLRVHSRWHQLAKSSREREQNLEEAHKTATKFQESCGELWNWLLETESRLDTQLRVTNEPEEINEELAKHEELRKALCSRLPQYYSTVRSGRCLRDKASLPTDTQKLSSLLEQLHDTWDRVCAKSTQRQQQLEEAVLYSGQPEGALQLMLDWLCWAETQLQEDQPIYGDMDLVSHLLESHQVFQRELYNRAGSVQALKRAAAELVEAGSGAGSGAGLGEAGWVGVLLQELSLRWDRVCSLSVSKQTRLQQALKQAEQFRNAVQQLLVWLSGVGQTRYHGAQPEDAETLQAVLHAHEALQEALEAKREEVIGACALGEVILSSCHPDSIALIRQRVTTLQTRYREVLMWAKQHKQALESSLAEMLNNSILLEELLSWLLWAETTLVQREAVSLPHDTLQIKTLIIEHQVFMEEMAQKRMDVERLTKSCQSKQTLSPESEKPGGMQQVTGGNPRLSQLCSLCQQVWQLSLNHQSKLSIALKRLEELEEGMEFDFDGWRRKCMQWVSRRKCNMMDMFQRVDTDQDGRITREEFTEVIVALDFPTSQWEMMAVMDLFDQDGSGNIDYYEFAAALHQSRDTSSHTTEADRIKEEVTRQVVQCKCKKRFRVEQIGENKYRLGQCECVLRILCNVLLVQMGHGWMSLNEFLMKNDPCRDVSHTQSFPRQLTGLLGGRTGGGEEQRDGQ